jgi:hypothetical protein
VICTHRSIGLGVRLGTTDVSKPKASLRAALLKVTFIVNLCAKLQNKVRNQNFFRKNACVVYTKMCTFTTLFSQKR